MKNYQILYKKEIYNKRHKNKDKIIYKKIQKNLILQKNQKSNHIIDN